jgi:hypothetical protein
VVDEGSKEGLGFGIRVVPNQDMTCGAEDIMLEVFSIVGLPSLFIICHSPPVLCTFA